MKVWSMRRVRQGLIVIFVMLLAYTVYKGFDQKAAEQKSAANHEVSPQTLKKTDVSAYLATLKADNDPRWESEFKRLDPQGYEAASKVEIANLTQELKTVRANDVDRFLAIYARLSNLDPTNDEYRKKRDNYSKQIADINSRRQQEMAQAATPEKFVTIENFSWSKGKFGRVMRANFSIKNSLSWPVKDIKVQCVDSAPSGTIIDSNERTIYERIESKKTKRIKNFDMGFIHSQAARSGCTVVGVVVIN